MSSLNLYADRKRFIPTGGVRKPSSRLAINIIAKCTGSIPKWLPKGAISGTMTIMAEKISIKQPTINKNILSNKKNIAVPGCYPTSILIP